VLDTTTPALIPSSSVVLGGGYRGEKKMGSEGRNARTQYRGDRHGKKGTGARGTNNKLWHQVAREKKPKASRIKTIKGKGTQSEEGQ